MIIDKKKEHFRITWYYQVYEKKHQPLHHCQNLAAVQEVEIPPLSWPPFQYKHNQDCILIPLTPKEKNDVTMAKGRAILKN